MEKFHVSYNLVGIYLTNNGKMGNLKTGDDECLILGNNLHEFFSFEWKGIFSEKNSKTISSNKRLSRLVAILETSSLKGLINSIQKKSKLKTKGPNFRLEHFFATLRKVLH